jgi:hypothetical protein
VSLVARVQFGCIGKHAYATEEKARTALRWTRERGAKGLTVYFCPNCKRYHVGHGSPQ